MAYRREIDGLRALAVAPVVMFHAGFEVFRGGFVGVDVFFVISGYLITGILLEDLQHGRYSIRRFYERRARRILPALFVVVLFCIPPAWVLLLPLQLKEFSQSIVAVSAFASNILFWMQSDYFATAAELKPLLHTWSLAVEEQYYLVFPLVLLLAWRLGRQRMFWLVVACAVLSFGIAEWGWRNQPSANFYLAPSRAWELLAGATAAFRPAAGNQKRVSHDWLAAAGLTCIMLSIFIYDSRTPFPSFYSLMPVIGTTLVLVFGQSNTWVGRLLSLRPLVGLGLVSYSAYLWHQPLFAFARISSGGEPPQEVMILLVGLTLLLAVLSWRFVEHPFRRPSTSSWSSNTFMIGAGVSVFAVGCLGVIGSLAPVDQLRFSRPQLAILSYNSAGRENAEGYRRRECFLDEDQTYAAFGAQCYNGQPGLIIGDSHAAALSVGLRDGREFGQLTASGCPPAETFIPDDRPNCRGVNEFVVEEIVARRPAYIVLHANWLRYDSAQLYSALAQELEALAATSARIVVVGGVPQYPAALPAELVASGRDLVPLMRLAVDLSPVRRVDKRLAATAAAHGASFFSIIDRICNAEGCIATVPDAGRLAPVAWDYGHLTAIGSQYIAGELPLPD